MLCSGERTAVTVRHDGLLVDWLGYATVRIEGPESVVYLDPGRYGVLDGLESRDGDLICVTHDHHYDSDGIARVAKSDARVLVYEGVDPDGIDRDVQPLEELPVPASTIGVNERTTVAGVGVETYPAYNHPDGPHVDGSGRPYHPEGFGAGYRVTIDGVPAFWPGDSDVLDFHADLDVSLFLPPIGGSFTMDRRGAAALAVEMDPDLVLPVHYDTFEAVETDAGAFAADVARGGVPVVLDEG